MRINTLKYNVFFFIFLPVTLFACESSKPGPFNLFASMEDGVGIYSKDNTISIFNCQNAAQTYLMIGIGPNVVTPNYVSFHTYDGTFRDDPSQEVSYPFETKFTYPEKLTFFKKQVNALKHCLQITVTDESNQTIQLPEQNLPFCNSVLLEQTKAILEGGLCYIKIKRDSFFKIKFSVNPACSEREFYQNNAISVLDVPFTIGFYQVKTDFQFVQELDPIRFVPGRFSVNPPFGVIPRSELYSSLAPSWPTQIAAKISFGDLNIQNERKNTVVNLKFAVDNRCSKKCANGICVSPCDYMIPIASEIKLTEINQSKSRKILENWYDGGIAFPFWQGLVPGVPHKLQYAKFKKGNTYKIEAIFYDPTVFYSLIKTKMKEFIIDPILENPETIGKNPIQALLPLPHTQFLSGFESIPSFGPFKTDKKNINQPLESALESLNAKISDTNWPPYITEFCVSDLSKCVSTLKNYAKPYLKFVIEFRVDEIKSENGEIKLTMLSN